MAANAASGARKGFALAPSADELLVRRSRVARLGTTENFLAEKETLAKGDL